MMVDLANDTNLKKKWFVKDNHQGQVIEKGFSEILDIENVRIDTKIESIFSIQPEMSKEYVKSV